MRDLTQGNIPKHLISFAVPTILGNMFQLTYNAADSIIVGRFISENALAAVGTANPIMNIVIFFIAGICLGTSVLMSEFYGKKDMVSFKHEVSTSMVIGAAFTIISSLLCIIFARPLLHLLNTPDEILSDATAYLQIIFSGLIFTFFYNIYSASLRSVGDSKTPIIFLILSSILNVSLDLIFIGIFDFGIRWAACSTVIAEAVSAILCVIYVYRKIPILKLKPKDIVVKKHLLKITVEYSWASAMQQTCLHIGKVLVQGAVNPLGIQSIAAFNAVNRVDDFAFTPQQSIAASMTTFIAQNRGAGNKERIKKGFRMGMIMEYAYSVCLGIIVLIIARPVLRLFLPDANSSALPLGVVYLTYMAFFYLLPASTNGIQGYFRGMGRMKVTLNSTFVQMLFRVIFAYIFAPRLGFSGIAFACLFGWIAMLTYEVPILLKSYKTLSSEVNIKGN